MEQDQPLSRTKMFIWSIIVIVGIIFLAAYTRPPSIKMPKVSTYQGHGMGLMHSPVEVVTVERSAEINIRMNFSNQAHTLHPDFACPRPCTISPLLAQLTTSNKPVAITLGE